MVVEFVMSLPSPPSVDVLSHKQQIALMLSRPGGFCDRARQRRQIAVVVAAGGAGNGNSFDGSNIDSKISHSFTDCTLDQEARHNRLSAHLQQHVDTSSGRKAKGFACDSINGNGSDVNSSPANNYGASPAIDLACKGGGAVGGVDLPFSLRMLKKKQKGNPKSTIASGLAGVGNSLVNAFSSTVFMVRTLQSHMFHIRQQFFHQEIEGLLNQVHRELHASFLWLFQQVFSCTPELMVLVMVLLADFTVFSMANNLPLSDLASSAASLPPLAVISSLDIPDASFVNAPHAGLGLGAFVKKPLMSSPSLTDNVDEIHGGSGLYGNGGKRGYVIAGGADGDPDPKYPKTVNTAVYSADDNMPSELSAMAAASVAQQELKTNQAEPPSNIHSCSVEDISASDFSAMEAAIAFQELSTAEHSNSEGPSHSNSNVFNGGVQVLSSKEATNNPNPLVLDQDIIRNLVAPFTAWLEDDNYVCYDRTELDYQYALSTDSMNSMLLTNFAQFLFLVRKDHDRAEELFRRAVVCDPSDGDAIARFASFLWLARRNLAAAEKAYKAAIRADPINSFHAANYAHFLWNSGQ